MRKTLLATAFLLAAALPVFGDGFHSPLLRGPTPRRWAETMRENLGLDRSDSAEEASVEGQGFTRRAAAAPLIDVLKYMDRKNILLREFPDFNYDHIPGFLSETEALLIAIGKDAVPLLVQTLVVNLMGNETPQGDLRLADNFVERIIRILVAIGEDSVDQIVARLDEPDSKVQKALLRILREIVKEPDFGKSIESWKKWYAIWRAGRDRDEKSVAALVKALEDSDRRFLLPAARALGEIGDRRAVPGLMRILEKGGADSLRVEAARALAKIGDLLAVAPLIELLESPRQNLREEGATALRFLTRETMGFDANGTSAERGAAVLRWREWWARRGR